MLRERNSALGHFFCFFASLPGTAEKLVNSTISARSIRKTAPYLLDFLSTLAFSVAGGVHNTCIASCVHQSNTFLACNRARHTFHNVDTAFFSPACASHIAGTIVSPFFLPLAMHLRLPRQSPGIPSRGKARLDR